MSYRFRKRVDIAWPLTLFRTDPVHDDKFIKTSPDPIAVDLKHQPEVAVIYFRLREVPLIISHGAQAPNDGAISGGELCRQGQGAEMIFVAGLQEVMKLQTGDVAVGVEGRFQGSGSFSIQECTTPHVVTTCNMFPDSSNEDNLSMDDKPKTTAVQFICCCDTMSKQTWWLVPETLTPDKFDRTRRGIVIATLIFWIEAAVERSFHVFHWNTTVQTNLLC